MTIDYGWPARVVAQRQRERARNKGRKDAQYWRSWCEYWQQEAHDWRDKFRLADQDLDERIVRLKNLHKRVSALESKLDIQIAIAAGLITQRNRALDAIGSIQKPGHDSAKMFSEYITEAGHKAYVDDFRERGFKANEAGDKFIVSHGRLAPARHPGRVLNVRPNQVQNRKHSQTTANSTNARAHTANLNR